MRRRWNSARSKVQWNIFTEFLMNLLNLLLRSPPVHPSSERAPAPLSCCRPDAQLPVPPPAVLLTAAPQSSQSGWRLSIIPPHYSIPFWARTPPQSLTHSPAKKSSLTYPFPLLFPTPEEALLASSRGCHRCLCWKSLLSIWPPAKQTEGLLSCCSKYKTPWLIIALEGTEIQGQHMFKQSARSLS